MPTADFKAMRTQAMTEFCEQVNPNVLLQIRTQPFPETRRVQESWVAAAEKRALVWLAAGLVLVLIFIRTT